MEDELLAIQRLYPQIFHACHVRHTRSRTTNCRALQQAERGPTGRQKP